MKYDATKCAFNDDTSQYTRHVKNVFDTHHHPVEPRASVTVLKKTRKFRGIWGDSAFRLQGERMRDNSILLITLSG